MIKTFTQNIIRFFVLIIIQVILINKIQFSGLINAHIYILFILLLPFEIPSWLLLILGFFTGFIIDIFSGTIAINTIATTFTCYIRPFALNLFSPREGYEKTTFPTLQYYSLTWVVKYTSLIVFIHHFVLYFVEVFRFSGFFFTLLRITLSSIFTILIILLVQFIFYKRK